MNKNDDEAELDDKFVQLGYESAYMPINLGTLLFVFFVQIMITILLVVIYMFKCWHKCKFWAGKKVDAIFFNSILKVIDATFLLIVMTSAINIQKVTEGKIGANSCLYVSIIGLIICFLELICIAGYLKAYQASLLDKKRISRCGYIYEGLNHIKSGYKALVLPLLQQLRVILLVYTILYLRDYLVVQVILIVYSSFYIIFIIGTIHPLEEYR